MSFLGDFGSLLTGLAGGIVGGLIAGPAGFAIGYGIGSMVGSLLFTDTPTVESGRLEDLQVQVSTYGNAIPDLYGTMRMSGNVIWVKGNKLQERTVSKKSSGVKYKTYKYSASLAVCICRGADAGAIGEIDGISKIWANSKLVYDADNDVKKPYARMKVYKGTTTQEADPTIAADVGAANCPAYRGRAYVVLKDFSLEDFGNRIPTFEFEVSRGCGLAYPSNVSIDSGNFRTWLEGNWFIDQEMGRLWFLSGSNVEVYDIETGTLVKTITLRNQTAGANYHNFVPNFWDRKAYLSSEDYGNTDAVCLTVFDMDDMEQLGTHSADQSGYDWIYFAGHTYSHGLRQIFTKYESSASGRGNLYPGIGQLSGDYIALPENPRNGLLWLERWEDLSGDIHPYPVMTQIDEALGLDPLPMDPVRLVVMGRTDLYVIESLSATGTETRIYYHYDSSEHGGGTYPYPTCFWDYKRNYLIVWMANDPYSGYDLIDLDALTVTRVNLSHEVNGGGYDAVNDRYLFWADPGAGYDTFYAYDAETGGLLLTRANAFTTTALENGWLIAPTTAANSVIALCDEGAQRVFLDKVPNDTGPTLQAVVSEISLKTQLTASDIDVSGLSGDVAGYAVTRNSSARAQLEPLRKAYRFDGVESDWQIAYNHRSGTAVKEIATDDLIGESDITLTRKQEAELPREIVLSYQEPEYDYQKASQRARKSTGNADQTTTIDLPMHLSADEAAQTAEILLHQDHLSRTGKAIAVPRKYLALDPGDVVQIPRGSEYYYALLTSTNYEDGKLALEGVKDHPRVYNSQAVGRVPEYTQATVYVPYLPKAFYIDCPMISDADDDAGWYWGAGLVKGTWKGVDLLVSKDGEFSAIGTETDQLTYGTVQGTMADADETVWDWTNSITVQMANSATLASATESEVIAGSNRALIGSSAGWEVVAFQAVTDNGGNNYTLTGFLRGRRGTECMCGQHVEGASFILVDDALSRVWDATANIDVEQYLKTVPFGMSSDLVRPTAFTNTAQGLMPYAVCHLTEDIDYATPQITLTWTRRTRIQGGYDVACVPVLGESTEEYEVDVVDNSDGSVVRTVTGLSSPSWTYTEALFSADWGGSIGTVTADLSFNVYQISAAAGRGFVSVLQSAHAVNSIAPDEIASLAAWYDANDTSTLYQDSAKTTAVTADSDPVGAIADKSGNGHDLLQASSSLRPSYESAGLNSSPSILFNGSHWLRSTTGASTGDQEHTIVLVLQDAGSSTTNRGYGYYGGAAATNQNSALGLESGPDWWFGGYGQALDGPPYSTSPVVLIKTYRTQPGDNAILYENGGQVDSAELSYSFTATDLGLGGHYWDGSAIDKLGKAHVSEAIFYDKELTASEALQLSVHLKDKWSIS